MSGLKLKQGMLGSGPDGQRVGSKGSSSKQVRVRTRVAQHFWTSQIHSNNSEFCSRFGIGLDQSNFGFVFSNFIRQSLDRQNKSLVWFG